jgi:hypothetical protein
MRNALLLGAACTVITSQAAIWNLDFGPAAGGFGINGANERPLPTPPSPATGREIQDYNGPQNFMQYDDALNRIEIHLGWGNIAGVDGTDLTGDFRMMHIHGPADVNTATGILYTLATWDGTILFAKDSLDDADDTANQNIPNNAGVRGYFDITFDLADTGGFTVDQQEQQLLGNEWYLNIHSTTYPGGEIRGQFMNAGLAVPEPEHYAMMAGLGLLGFAGYRRFKVARA